MLHWANRAQYYVKSSERFTDYRFRAGEYAVSFRLYSADIPKDDIKSNNRYFVLHADEPISYDSETRMLTIPFAYRSLSKDEEKHYVAEHNRLNSEEKSRLQRRYVCEAIEDQVLSAISEQPLTDALNRPETGANHSALYSHLNQYTARNTMDYFVHKDLGGFLTRELDVFLKTQLVHLDHLLSDRNEGADAIPLVHARVVREIARKIIDFLVQIEDFQRRLFEKRKFLVQTDYCVTLDRVPPRLYDDIRNNELQLEQWRQLYQMQDWQQDLLWQGELSHDFLTNHPYLMIDTALFEESFKWRLLESFDDLHQQLDGILIWGENFQALNLLMARFRQRVKCIYIDPPFNTDNDGFLYKDNYKHSSWLTMMNDRIRQGARFLRKDGAMYVSIDDREQDNLKKLMDSNFGRDNLLSQLVWEKVHTRKNSAKTYSIQHEYVLAYAKERDSWGRTLLPRDDTSAYSNPDNDPRGDWKLDPIVAHNPYSADYTITKPNGVVLGPPEDGYWRYSKESWDSFMEEERVVWGEGDSYPMVKRFLSEVQEGLVPVSLFKIDDYVPADVLRREDFGDTALSKRELGNLFAAPPQIEYVKPTKLVKQIIRVSAGNSGEWVMDYFAGSGTTGHAVIDLNREDGAKRKYILVEMGHHFDTILKPRILKAVFSSEWKDGVPQDRNGISQLIKYHRIESYDDALNNICLRQPETGQRELLRRFDDYMLHYILDFETRGSPTLLAQQAFENPFEYTLEIQQPDQTRENETVDLLETFHYLIGMRVSTIDRHNREGRTYVISQGEVETNHGIQKVATVWRDAQSITDEQLRQEAQWLDAQVFTEPPDRVYVNGPSFIKNGQPLEIAFHTRLEGGLYASD